MPRPCPLMITATVSIYRMEGNFGGGNVGELTCFKHLTKKFGELIDQSIDY